MESIQLRTDYIFQFTKNTGWRKDLNALLKEWVNVSNAELFEKVTEFLNKIKNKEYKNEPTDFPYDILTEWAENSLIWLKHLIERDKTGEPNINGLEEFVNASSRAGNAFRYLQEFYEIEKINIRINPMLNQFNPLLPNNGWRQEVNIIRKLYKCNFDYHSLLPRVHALMLDVKHHRIGKLSNYERTNLKEWGENWMRIWTFLKNNDYRTTHPDINMLDCWQDSANHAFMNLLKLNPSKRESFNDR